MSHSERPMIAAALARLGSATIGESGGLAAHRRLRPAWSGAAVAAPAYPVGCTPGDNLAVHVAVTKAPRGSVLVVDVGQVADRGYWGEVLTTAAEAAGLAGLVLDGGRPRRRRARGARLPGVLVDHRPHRRHARTSRAPSALPVRVGGVEVAAGDWVVADVDGVAFVPRASVDDVLAAGRDRETKEAGFFEALEVGLDDGGVARARCVAGAPGRRQVALGPTSVAQCRHERRDGGESDEKVERMEVAADDPG